MQGKCAYIFANGILERPNPVRLLIQPDDLIVAADGGLSHILALDLIPSWLVGDLDSVQPADFERMQELGVRIEKHPTGKDDTDLELALQAVLDAGFRSIRIVAALGDRVDHTLGNLFLLTRPDLASHDVRLEDGVTEIFVIHSQAVITGELGDVISLIPTGNTVEGITTSGLDYPLYNETLFPYRTRGISNVMTAHTATVTVKSGALFCIHRRNQKPSHLPKE